MLATHESMELPGLSSDGFRHWRAVELVGRQPRYLLSLTGASGGDLDLLFGVDQELMAFLDTIAPALSVALHVLLPAGTAGSSGWQLLGVQRLVVFEAPDGDGSCVTLVMRNGQSVRARDLAPVDHADVTPTLSYSFVQ